MYSYTNRRVASLLAVMRKFAVTLSGFPPCRFSQISNGNSCCFISVPQMPALAQSAVIRAHALVLWIAALSDLPQRALRFHLAAIPFLPDANVIDRVPIFIRHPRMHQSTVHPNIFSAAGTCWRRGCSACHRGATGRLVSIAAIRAWPSRAHFPPCDPTTTAHGACPLFAGTRARTPER